MLLTALLSEGSIIDLDGTFVVQLALFTIAFFVLRKLVFHPVIAVIEAREEAIEGSRKKARDLEQSSVAREKEFQAELRKAHHGAAEERDKIRADAKRMQDQLLSKVKAETEKQVEASRKDMDREAAKVREEMKVQVPMLAKEIAAKLLQREVG